jgi:hypothetical protein
MFPVTGHIKTVHCRAKWPTVFYPRYKYQLHKRGGEWWIHRFSPSSEIPVLSTRTENPSLGATSEWSGYCSWDVQWLETVWCGEYRAWGLVLGMKNCGGKNTDEKEQTWRDSVRDVNVGTSRPPYGAHPHTGLQMFNNFEEHLSYSVLQNCMCSATATACSGLNQTVRIAFPLVYLLRVGETQ